MPQPVSPYQPWAHEEVNYGGPGYVSLKALPLPNTVVISRWDFTPEERRKIAEGGTLVVEQLTLGNPLQGIRLSIVTSSLEVLDKISDGYHTTMSAGPNTPL